MKFKGFINLLFLALISLYIGAAVFRVTDPEFNLFGSGPTPAPVILPVTKIPPTSIRIPKLQKELPISAALVHDNQWDLFPDKVAWLSTSAVPGEGNVILYAHNRAKLFGGLYKLVPGDEVFVDQNNNWLKYVVSEVHKVTPTDVGAILSDKNRLTMYTCEGSFDQKRLVVYAELAK